MIASTEDLWNVFDFKIIMAIISKNYLGKMILDSLGWNIILLKSADEIWPLLITVSICSFSCKQKVFQTKAFYKSNYFETIQVCVQYLDLFIVFLLLMVNWTLVLSHVSYYILFKSILEWIWSLETSSRELWEYLSFLLHSQSTFCRLYLEN